MPMTADHLQSQPDSAETALRAAMQATSESPATVVTRGQLLGAAQRWLSTMLILSGLTCLVLIVCLQYGVQRIGLLNILSILWHAIHGTLTQSESADPTSIILLQVRLPRLLLGFMVGASLAAVGGALQALVRNPLADPYVLGISSGAALGAAVAMSVGVGKTVLASSALPFFAFIGGLLSIIIVYRIAVSHGHLAVHTLLLAGVILSAIFSALIMFATSITDPTSFFRIMFWLMGTLTAPEYPALAMLALYFAIGTFLLFRQAQSLNLLALGEESALSLGVNVERVKKVLFFTAALLTGAVVSMSGIIGFVGMVIPHVVRMTLGADHRTLLPASALVGGTLLMAADTVARTVLAPTEIPVGVITALAGGPFFIYLLMSRKNNLET